MKQSGKFTLRIDQDLINFLKKEATKEGLTLSAYIRRMLRAHLNKTKIRVVVTNNTQDHRGHDSDGEESSRERKSEEPAHLAFTD